MMKWNVNHLVLYPLLVSHLCLFNACGSDSGSDAIESPAVSEVNTSFELGKCTIEKQGTTVFVRQENVDYICTETGWIAQGNVSSDLSSDTPFMPYSSSEKVDSSLFKNVSSSSFSSLSRISSSSINKNETLYGTFIDKRDGKKYKYVTIKTQTWMAENLNYTDSIKSPVLSGGGSWCTNNKEEYCEIFGRFYPWDVAVDAEATGCKPGVDCSSKTIQGICPDGWHIPTYADIAMLYQNVGGTDFENTSRKEIVCGVLKSAYWWHEDNNGSDIYGFNLLPAGKSDMLSGSGGSVVTRNITGFGGFWSMDSSASYAYRVACSWHKYAQYGISVSFLGTELKNPYKGLNVRCVKDSVDYSPSTRNNEKNKYVVKKEIFTDERDGNKYKYVIIGSQTWMAENLRFDPGEATYHTSMVKYDNQGCVLGCYIEDTVSTYKLGNCFNSGTDSAYCGYLFAGAMDSINTLCGYGSPCKEGYSTRGNCPDGWRIPSVEDFKKLIEYAGGSNIAGFLLRKRDIWDGNFVTGYNQVDYGGLDLYGFSAGSTLFVTSSEMSDYDVQGFVVHSTTGDAYLERTSKSSGFAVRCIKGEE